MVEGGAMKNKDIRHWVVIVGTPIFISCSRRAARDYAKENKPAAGKWNYIGKCPKNSRKIIVDI